MSIHNPTQKYTSSRHQQMAEHLSLYLVTDPKMCGVQAGRYQQLIDTVCQAIAGGVTLVQLRDKHADDEQLYEMACMLKEAINGQVPLLMNDHVVIAKKAKLDGAHIGQSDAKVAHAREILGADAWLGLSVSNPQQMQTMIDKHAHHLDYIGVGPVYPTSTKPDHAPAIGIQGVGELIGMSPLPSVAIGSVTADNVSAIRATGVDGIAVVSAICAANDPKAAAQRLSVKNLTNDVRS